MNAWSLLNLEESCYDFVILFTFKDSSEGLSLFTDTRSAVFVDHDRRCFTLQQIRARVTETYNVCVTQSELTSIILPHIFLKLSNSLFTITLLRHVIVRFLSVTTVIVINIKSCYMHWIHYRTLHSIKCLCLIPRTVQTLCIHLQVLDTSRKIEHASVKIADWSFSLCIVHAVLSSFYKV
jgi:hypothetical protein